MNELLIVVDVETTGLDPREDEVVQAAMLPLEGTLAGLAGLDIRREQVWEAKLHPSARTPTAMNSYDPAIWAREALEQPEGWRTIFTELHSLCSEEQRCVFVGSNPAFDRDFFKQAAKRYGFKDCISHRTVDVSAIFRYVCALIGKTPRSYSLCDIAENFGIEFRHHDAVEDVWAAANIVQELLKIETILKLGLPNG